jgi:hypothetical protein
VARTDVLRRELEDVIREFSTLTGQRLPAINRLLNKKKLAAIEVISEPQWQAQHKDELGGTAPSAQMRRQTD